MEWPVCVCDYVYGERGQEILQVWRHRQRRQWKSRFKETKLFPVFFFLFLLWIHFFFVSWLLLLLTELNNRVERNRENLYFRHVWQLAMAVKKTAGRRNVDLLERDNKIKRANQTARAARVTEIHTSSSRKKEETEKWRRRRRAKKEILFSCRFFPSYIYII